MDKTVVTDEEGFSSWLAHGRGCCVYHKGVHAQDAPGKLSSNAFKAAIERKVYLAQRRVRSSDPKIVAVYEYLAIKPPAGALVSLAKAPLPLLKWGEHSKKSAA